MKKVHKAIFFLVVGMVIMGIINNLSASNNDGKNIIDIFNAGSNYTQTDQSKYLIDVSISEQKVRIYENGQKVQEWIASTGENDSTPLGNFVIQNRGEWFFSEKYQQGGKWWVSFKGWGNYLFHSIPMDREQNILADEADKIGSPASHGCVRLQEADAKWIYDHIPQGASVNIHK